MMSNSHIAFLATLMLVLQSANSVDAGCCDRCGASCTTQLVCWTICTTKIVENTYWDEQCEAICMPPKSVSVAGCMNNLSCDACDTCEPCDGCAPSNVRIPLFSGWSSLLRHPGKCHFRDRSKLMRKSYVEYVPTLECVVEHLCPGCCGGVTPLLTAGESDMPTAQPVPADAAPPPVRLQISDQPPEPESFLSPVIDAERDLGEILPEEGQALAPISPVNHILTR